jgi:hypothetical protein
MLSANVLKAFIPRIMRNKEIPSRAIPESNESYFAKVRSTIFRFSLSRAQSHVVKFLNVAKLVANSILSLHCDKGP